MHRHTVCVSGKMLPLYTKYKSKLLYLLCQTLSNDCWTVDCLCNYWQNKAKFTGSISISVNADQEPCGSSQLFAVTAATCGIETGIPATRSWIPRQTLDGSCSDAENDDWIYIWRIWRYSKKDFKAVKELKRDCFPNYSLMGLTLFEIFCKGKILNTFGFWTHFPINRFSCLFLQKMWLIQ